MFKFMKSVVAALVVASCGTAAMADGHGWKAGETMNISGAVCDKLEQVRAIAVAWRAYGDEAAFKVYYLYQKTINAGGFSSCGQVQAMPSVPVKTHETHKINGQTWFLNEYKAGPNGEGQSFFALNPKPILEDDAA